MGLFSGLTEIAGGLIGTAVGGPAGGALGSSLGGIVGNQLDNNRTGRLNNRQAKKDYALHRKRFEHTVADAKAAGIHPLEALRSGGANTSPNYTPRLQTTNARDQDFDTIQSVLTGEYAENRSRDRLNDELTRVDIDNARRGRIPKSGPGPNTDLRPPKFDADGNPIPRKENYLVEVWNPLIIDPETGKMGVNYFLPNPELHEMSHTEFASSTALHVAFGGVQLIWDGVLKGYRLPKDGETPDANAPTVDSIRQGGGATPTPKPATPKAPKPLIPYTPNLRPAFGAN